MGAQLSADPVSDVIPVSVHDHTRIKASLLSRTEQSRTESFAGNMIRRLTSRDYLYGPLRSPPVSRQERDALALILENCKKQVLRRVPMKGALVSLDDARKANPLDTERYAIVRRARPLLRPERRELMLAFTTGTAQSKLTTASHDPTDPILFDSDNGDKKRAYVTLEATGHRLYLPLTTQGIKALKNKRRALQKEASGIVTSGGFAYSPSSQYQYHLEKLVGAFDIIIDGVKQRSRAKKPAQAHNKFAPTTRHRNYDRERNRMLEEVAVASAEGVTVTGVRRVREAEHVRRKDRNARLMRHGGNVLPAHAR